MSERKFNESRLCSSIFLLSAFRLGKKRKAGKNGDAETAITRCSARVRCVLVTWPYSAGRGVTMKRVLITRFLPPPAARHISPSFASFQRRIDCMNFHQTLIFYLCPTVFPQTSILLEFRAFSSLATLKYCSSFRSEETFSEVFCASPERWRNVM